MFIIVRCGRFQALYYGFVRLFGTYLFWLVRDQAFSIVSFVDCACSEQRSRFDPMCVSSAVSYILYCILYNICLTGNCNYCLCFTFFVAVCSMCMGRGSCYSIVISVLFSGSVFLHEPDAPEAAQRNSLCIINFLRWALLAVTRQNACYYSFGGFNLRAAMKTKAK